MSIRVNVHPSLYHLTNNQEVVVVQGTTIGQCLKHLIEQFPDMEEALFDKNGKLLNYVDIYINMESAYPELLDRKVKESDELHLMPVIQGG